MSRRARRNGFGTIIATGTTTHPAFVIRWWEGSRRKKKSGFRTRTDAAEALARVRTGLGDGTLVEKRRAGVGFDEVARQWLDLHSKATLRSHALNEMNYRVHIAPAFGDALLVAITSTRVLELRGKLQAGGLAPRTVNLMMALVRGILRFAVANGHIAASPTDRLGRGKLMLPVEKTKLAPPIVKGEDVGRVLDAVREIRPDRHALFATLVYTGMRKGEACGLRWADVDLERRIITVRHSYAGQTKSGSHREVPIHGALVDILKRHRLAEPWGGEIVFPNDRGMMYTKNGKLEDLLRAALGRVGLPSIRLHDLRHVYACHFLMAGGSVYDLQKNLGHHSVAFTADIYGHLSADHRVREVDRLNFEAPEPATVLPFASASR
jgi:integrase